jgi:hypothetical protein
MITPKTAELLSYLQGLGPVGGWVSPEAEWLRADLGINNRNRLFLMIDEMRKQGIIETRRPHGGRHRLEYKVLRRIEQGIEIGLKPRKPSSGRPMGRANGWRVPTGLVQFAGSEVMA